MTGLTGIDAVPRHLSVKQIADRYGVSVTLVYQAIYRGDLPAVRLGKRTVRIAESDAVDFAKRIGVPAAA